MADNPRRASSPKRGSGDHDGRRSRQRNRRQCSTDMLLLLLALLSILHLARIGPLPHHYSKHGETMQEEGATAAALQTFATPKKNHSRIFDTTKQRKLFGLISENAKSVGEGDAAQTPYHVNRNRIRKQILLDRGGRPDGTQHQQARQQHNRRDALLQKLQQQQRKRRMPAGSAAAAFLLQQRDQYDGDDGEGEGGQFDAEEILSGQGFIPRPSGGQSGHQAADRGVQVADKTDLALQNPSGFQSNSEGQGIGGVRLKRLKNVINRQRKTRDPKLNPFRAELKFMTTDSESNFISPVERQREPDEELEAFQNEYLERFEAGEFFNYSQPAVRRATTLPDPKIQKDAKLVVLVISSRANLEQRKAIRETWAQNHTVYFLLGGLDKPHMRKVNRHFNITLHDVKKYKPTTESTFKAEVVHVFPNGTNIVSEERHMVEHVEESADLQPKLVEEAETYGDVIDVIHPDKYTSLPYKLRFGLRWVTKNLPNVEWVTKVDDDMHLRVDTLYKTLLHLYNPQVPIIMGDINVNAKVFRWNYWFEYFWPFTKYPPFPLGSFGYVLSASVVHYIAQIPESDITYYQGEDTSLGLWIDQGNLEVLWMNTDLFFNNRGGSCQPDLPWIIQGHYLSPEQIRECHAQLDEWPQNWVKNALSYVVTSMCGSPCLGPGRGKGRNGKSFTGFYGGGLRNGKEK